MGKENIAVGIDGFEAALTGILNDIDYDVSECLQKPVKHTLNMGRRQLNRESPKKTGRYSKGWRYTMKGKGKSVLVRLVTLMFLALFTYSKKVMLKSAEDVLLQFLM
jgi:hypothetical protein